MLGTYGLAASNSDVGITPPEFQSDARISVWVNDAPLSVFVTQLASITGRDVSIEGDFSGKVSGNFNGSMADTLLAMSDQFPVIFDMSSSSLSVVPESAKTTATVALGNSVVDDELLKTVMSNVLTGNDIDVREGEVVISGHPSFVKRVASTVLKNGISKPENSLPVDAEQPGQDAVVDIAAQFMLDDDITEAASAAPTETASAAQAGITTIIPAATAVRSENAGAFQSETSAAIQSDNAVAIESESAANGQSEIAVAIESETAVNGQSESVVAIESETAANDQSEAVVDIQSETAPAAQTETTSTPRPILWVTDIPGFDTF